jgi:hypothetical protein
MKLTVNRNTYSNQSTQGDLLIDGIWYCYTLEPVMRQVIDEPVVAWKQWGVTAIPTGTYNVTMRVSPKFKRIMPHIENVEDFSEVMLHPLNVPTETQGCIGVGFVKDINYIGNSRSCSDELNKRIQAAIDAGEQVTIDITNT